MTLGAPLRTDMMPADGTLSDSAPRCKPRVYHGELRNDRLSVRMLAKRGITTWDQLRARLWPPDLTAWRDPHLIGAMAWMVAVFGSESDNRLAIRAMVHDDECATVGCAFQICADRVDPLWLGLTALDAIDRSEAVVAPACLGLLDGRFDWAECTLCPAFVEWTTRLLRDKRLDGSVRAIAADRLARYYSPEVATTLLAGLTDAEAEVRLVCCDCLGERGFLPARHYIEAMARTDHVRVEPYGLVSDVASEVLRRWDANARVSPATDGPQHAHQRCSAR